jgi:hypothetical protein
LRHASNVGDKARFTKPAGGAVAASSTSRTLARVRLTELWRRLEEALGESYARSWAADFHISSLGGLTVLQAIDAGVETVDIWRAVHATLSLPANQR